MKINILICAALIACAVTNNATAATWYVATNGSDSAAGTNWVTAKKTIQAAIDLSNASDLVLVSNGVYDTGGRVVFGAMTNRVAITKPITVQSANGSGAAAIRGVRSLDDNAVRCVYVTNNAFLVGFTLTNGSTRASGDANREQSGGGAWCEPSGVLSNCIINANTARIYGGGVYQGTLYNCMVSVNLIDGLNGAADGGGAYNSTLNNCVLNDNTLGGSFCYEGDGGGSYGGTLNNCILHGNRAIYNGGGASGGILSNCVLYSNTAGSLHGGGVYNSTLNNCILYDNYASTFGGGSYGGTLNNCILHNNMGASGGGGSYGGTLYNCTICSNEAPAGWGGGSYNSTLNNCIIYFNSSAPLLHQYENYKDTPCNYCCTTPAPGGTGNITNAPQFMGGLGRYGYHLSPRSPCIDKGDNSYVTSSADLDGHRRIVNGVVDMGAYESGLNINGEDKILIDYVFTNQFGLRNIIATPRLHSNLIDIDYLYTNSLPQAADVRGFACAAETDVTNLNYSSSYYSFHTFVEGTATNYGAGIMPSASLRHLTWDAGTDIGHSVENIKVLLWASATNALPASLQFVTIPASGTNAALTISRYAGLFNCEALNRALMLAVLRGWATNSGASLYAIGGTYAGQLVFTNSGLPTASGKLWLCEKLGSGIRLATAGEIQRAREGTTPGTVAQRPSYRWSGMKVNQYNIETGVSNAWYFVKE